MNTSMQLAVAIGAVAFVVIGFRLTMRMFRSPNAPRWTQSDWAGTFFGLVFTALPAMTTAMLMQALVALQMTVWIALVVALASHILAYIASCYLLPVRQSTLAPPAGGIMPA